MGAQIAAMFRVRGTRCMGWASRIPPRPPFPVLCTLLPGPSPTGSESLGLSLIPHSCVPALITGRVAFSDPPPPPGRSTGDWQYWSTRCQDFAGFYKNITNSKDYSESLLSCSPPLSNPIPPSSIPSFPS